MNPLHRRTVLGAAGLLAMSGGARAANWPDRTVRVIVPYTPGGSTDITARIVNDKLAAAFGQKFLTDNRPGAGGNLGMDLAVHAKPDGYTLGVATTAHAINMTLFQDLTYDINANVTPIALLTENPLILVVTNELSPRTVPELIALAKTRQLHFASSGNGQSTHLAAELFSSMAGIKMLHVPYRGSAPAIQDVIAGRCDLIFDSSQSALPHVEEGSVRALGVTSAAAMPTLPNVPPIATTLPGYEAFAWNGLVGPAGMPPAVTDTLNKQVLAALADPGVMAKFAALGATSHPTTPAKFGAYLKAETAKWGKVVKDSGARSD